MAADANALTSALATLAAQAEFKGPEVPIYLRVAGVGGNIYIDMGDPEWRAIEVTKAGWHVLDNSPVKFYRPDDTEALPDPVRGGYIDELRSFLNVGDDEWTLLKGFLVTALQDSGPLPILVFKGQQGTGKTTRCRMLARFIDPRESIPGSPPREVRDLIVAAKECWFPTYDNVSHISPEVSDTCCRLATGTAFSEGELYANYGRVSFKAKRPHLFNGITGLAETRGDFLSRATLLELEVIPPGQYESETTLWAAFNEAAPRIFGAILDALAEGLRNIQEIVAKSNEHGWRTLKRGPLRASRPLTWRRAVYASAHGER